MRPRLRRSFPLAAALLLVTSAGASQSRADASARSCPPAATTPCRAPQTRLQQKCLNALNKAGAAVAKRQNRTSASCAKAFAAGKTERLGTPATVEACLENDVEGKLAKAQAKTLSAEGKACDPAELPDFANPGAAAVNEAAREHALLAVHGLFDDLDASLVPKATDEDAARCQAAALAGMTRSFDAFLKAALGAKRAALASADTASALAAALGTALAADAKLAGKRAKAASKLAQRCEGASLDGLFPGACPAAASAAELGTCAGDLGACQACLALASMDEIPLDCSASSGLAVCRPGRCGNGRIEGVEDCDDGNTAEGDGCDADCVAEVCGNGELQLAAGEECDDGSTTAGDGCDGDCLLESCGDGETQPSEGCDDGNTAAGDGCDALCLIEECGNGIVQAGEECDDGDTTSNDGCSSSCETELDGGWIVASRVDPPRVSVYDAQDPALPVEVIPNARLTDTLLDAAGKRVGVAYGIPGFFDYLELGIFTSFARVVLGAEPGHEYRYLALIDGPTRRVVYTETSVVDSYALRTVTLDGSESHLLHPGCQTISQVRVGPSGVLFLCKQSNTAPLVFYSDGVVPAVQLPGSATRRPARLTATHALMYDGSDGSQLRTQPLAGALGGSPQLDMDLITPPILGGGGKHDLLAVNPQGIVLGRTYKAGATPGPFEAWTVNADGSNPSTRYTSYGAPLFVELSPDGSKAALVYQSMAGAFAANKGVVISLALPNSGADPLNPLYLLPFPANTSVSDVHFLSGGRFAGTWGSAAVTTSLHVHNADGTDFFAVSAYQRFNRFVDTKDDYLLYRGGHIDPEVFKSSSFDGTVDLTLSSSAREDPRATLRSDGIVTFVDDDDYAWIASADPAIPAPVRLLQHIDEEPTYLVQSAGDGSGRRVFLNLYRTSTEWDFVMFDLDDETTTPILVGPTSDIGYFFPD